MLKATSAIHLSHRHSKEERMTSLMASLWERQVDTDVIFRCPDGEIGAHKPFVKLLCPILGALLPPCDPGGAWIGPATCVLVPNFSIKIVQNFLQMLYTGSTGVVSGVQLDEIRQFGFTQLGFVMMPNWNVSIDTINKPSNQEHLNFISIKEEPLDFAKSSHPDPGSTADQEENVANSTKSRNSPDRISTYSENSTEPNLVIDDNPSSSGNPGSWWPHGQGESDRLRSESMDSSDPLVADGDSDNEYYDQQDGANFDPASGSGLSLEEFAANQKNRRKRTSISHTNLAILRKAFIVEPFPSRQSVNKLSSEIRLPYRVIKVWFQNERAKKVKKLGKGALKNYDLMKMAAERQAHASPGIPFPGQDHPVKQYPPQSHTGGLFPIITGVTSGPFNPADPIFGPRDRKKDLLRDFQRGQNITIIPLGHINDEKNSATHTSGRSSSPTVSLTKDPPARRFVHPAAATTIQIDSGDETKVSQTYLKREVERSRQSDSESAHLPAPQITLASYSGGDRQHHEH